MKIKANNKEIEVGGLVLDFSASGIVLSFSIKNHIKEAAKLYNQSLVECISTGSTTGRVFLGRVRSVRRAEGGGLWNVEVWDFKKEMFDIPFFGRSLQKRDTDAVGTYTARKRWATVKYAFTKEDVTEGELYYWTVGSMLQDVINQMCGECPGTSGAGDNLPTFYDYFPEEIVDEWKYNYDSPTGADWQINWNDWIQSARQTTSTHPFSELDRKPWGVQFSGEKVGTVINNILNRYYPSYNWWINPQTMLIEIVKTYELNPEEHDTNDKLKRVYLSNLAPVLENCFTRVILEGQSSIKEEVPAGYKDGFINSDAPTKAGTATYYITIPGDPPVTGYRTYTETGIDMETQFSSMVASGDTAGTPKLAGEAGFYYKDNRDIFDTATDFPDKYRGAAFEKFGIKRTMVLIDNELGNAVFLARNTDDEDDEYEELVDRSQGMEDLSEEILEMLSAVRYTGKLEIKASPFINPFQRITVKNHPLHGTITFSPQSMRWEDKFGFRSYTLGDNKYNPIEEFKLLKQLKWRDKEDPRKREPKVLKT